MTRRSPIIELAAAVYVLDTASRHPTAVRMLFAVMLWAVCIVAAVFGVIGLFCAPNAQRGSFLVFSLILLAPLVLVVRARRRPAARQRDADFFDEAYRNYRD